MACFRHTVSLFFHEKACIIVLKSKEGGRTTMKIKASSSNVISMIAILLAAAMITVSGIISEQHVLKIIPLYVSLFVGMLQSRASRYACLIGGFNAILYSIVYFFFGLYASFATALLVSCPMQLATFIRWSKNPYKHSTHFRRLKPKKRILVLLLFLISFGATYLVLCSLGSSYRILDLTVSLISVFTSVLTLMSFIEYSYTMLASGLFSIILDATMIKDYPGQITYLIFSVYSMICIIRQFVSVRKIYSEQTKGDPV